MNSTLMAVSRAEEQGQQMLTSWPTLDDKQQAFVVAYVENGYSIAAASEALELPVVECRRFLNVPGIRKAVTEVQEALGDIEFLNEKWVKAQLLRLFPMVMGEEEVPLVDNTGCQIQARVFKPEVAMKVLEYVAPKKAPLVQVNLNAEINLTAALEEAQARRRAAHNIIDVTPE